MGLRVLALLSILSTAACGLGEPGVRSIAFDLRPTAASQLAELGVEAGPTVVFELMSASARLTVDPLAGAGLLLARDLPTFARRSYLVRLDVAADERAGLPTVATAQLEGHVYALAPDAAGAGRWRLAFDAVPGHELGAVRAATVFLVRTETATLADGGHHPIPGTAVLSGSAADVTPAGSTSGTSGGAHVHGI